MKESKSTTIYKHLKEAIQKGQYFPNEKLTEADLARKYETSRNTIRSVLSLLEKENLVTIEPHKGAKVATLVLDDIVNILDLRAEIEEYILKKTTPNLSKKDLNEMEAIYSKMKSNIEKDAYQDHPQLNTAFHEVIYSKCDNTIAVEVVRDLKNRLSNYNFKTILIPGRTEKTLQEHQAILDAVTKHDGDLAAQKAKEHIYSVRDTIISYSRLLINT
ncbi:MAG: GntR family transcriptional regulator [Tetragenococcus sp.]|nr:GntR family transcriptional regulator [Tetragenococcus sp.]